MITDKLTGNRREMDKEWKRLLVDGNGGEWNRG
jgi:hypothetical protein